jgi:very-short-patch-repair endonuclease
LDPGALNRRVIALAARQHGVITRAQLISLGMSAPQITRRLKAGSLRQLYRGVYLVGTAPPGAQELAAVFACSPSAFASHHTGAKLHSLPLPAPPTSVHITVIGRSVKRPGIIVHRVRALPADETWKLDGIPVTSPARTIVDLAPSLGSEPLEQLIAEACARNADTRSQLETLLRRYPGRPGVPAITGLLHQPHGPAFTRSRAERLLLRLLREAELPAPQANAKLLGYEVDLLWEELKLVGEFDSHAFHAARPKRERDSLRDQDLIRRGYAVIRITWNQLTRRPTALLARIALTMGRRECELAR